MTQLLEERATREVAGIPTEIIDDHHEIYFVWKKHEIKHSTLIHIDAHHDMSNKVFLEGKTETKFPGLSISNFICAGMHEGIISDIYWMNPHWKGNKVVDFGTVSSTNNRQSLTTIEQDGCVIWEYHNRELVPYIVEKGGGKNISEDEINPTKYNVSIDLDAFCCDKYVHSPPPRLEISLKGIINWFFKNDPRYDTITGWEARIKKTGEFLDRLLDRTQISPELVTIARSQKTGQWVPREYVNEVQYRTIEMLRKTIG